MSEPFVLDWPFVESDMNAWRSWAGREAKMLDTDALLKPIAITRDQLTAWQDVVKANTGAFKEIRVDLGQCNNQEKVQAIINKVEQALQDLSVESQKIPTWVKEDKGPSVIPNPNLMTVAYGQYPINQPLNPANPVPWPPGYTPSGTGAAVGVEGVSAEPEPVAQTAKGGKK
jgi:hypothetical protein